MIEQVRKKMKTYGHRQVGRLLGEGLIEVEEGIERIINGDRRRLMVINTQYSVPIMCCEIIHLKHIMIILLSSVIPIKLIKRKKQNKTKIQ